MKHQILIALAAFALGTAPASADPRIVEQPYREGAVVPVTAHSGYSATIAFAPDERVENVALGNSAQWQVTPNKRASLIFLKPVAANAGTTNMTVVTDRRTYLFELRASARAQPLYLLRFAYPEALVPPASDSSIETGAVVPVAASASAEPHLAARLNFAWKASGASELLPDRVFDDGEATYLAWPQGKALPAVLSPAPDGKGEGPVNFSASGEYLVIDGVHPRLILRSGGARAELIAERAPFPTALAGNTAQAPLAIGQ